MTREIISTNMTQPDHRVQTLQNADASARDVNSAFAGIHGELERPLLAYALKLTGSHHLAEEVVQEAFIRGLGSIDRIDANEGSFNAWLFTIVHNTAIGVSRTESRHVVGRSEDISADIQARNADPVEQLEFKENLTTLASLPERYKKALGWGTRGDYGSIAAETGLSVGNIRTRVHTARQVGKEALRQGRYIKPKIGSPKTKPDSDKLEAA